MIVELIKPLCQFDIRFKTVLKKWFPPLKYRLWLGISSEILAYFKLNNKNNHLYLSISMFKGTSNFYFKAHIKDFSPIKGQTVSQKIIARYNLILSPKQILTKLILLDTKNHLFINYSFLVSSIFVGSVSKGKWYIENINNHKEVYNFCIISHTPYKSLVKTIHKVYKERGIFDYMKFNKKGGENENRKTKN